MQPYISGRPSLHLSHLFVTPRNQKNIFPIKQAPQRKLYFFFSARYALAAGIKALGIGVGDQILLPSYNCGVEIDPVLHSGIQPVFYKIGKDLLVDFDDLIAKITQRVRAVLVTHYLGFPQPLDQIKKVCIERNIYLIEDCAHSFLSTINGNFLGSYGDVAIFSLLKTLPVPNGGILILNNGKETYEHRSTKPSLFSTLWYAAELLKYRTRDGNKSINENIAILFCNALYSSLAALRLFLTVFRKLSGHKGLYLVCPDSYLFIDSLRSWGISELSKNILQRTDFERIKSIRMRNFEYLLDHFVKHKRGILPFRNLPPGVSPLFFPIIIRDGETRDKLHKTLKTKGVITHPWWDRFHPQVPWDEFPDAVYLKQRLFGLPIHQDISLDHLNYVIGEFEKVYQNLTRKPCPN
jgi:perosamine synthetase